MSIQTPLFDLNDSSYSVTISQSPMNLRVFRLCSILITASFDRCFYRGQSVLSFFPQIPQQIRMSRSSNLQYSRKLHHFNHFTPNNTWHSSYAQAAILKIEHKKTESRAFFHDLCFVLLSI
jgi:hypothetical protein